MSEINELWFYMLFLSIIILLLYGEKNIFFQDVVRLKHYVIKVSIDLI